MAENFRLDADGVARATKDLRSAGDALSEAFDQLAAALDEHDGCWGEDETGKKFAEGYAGPAGDVRAGADDGVQSIKNVSDGVDDASAQFQDTDEESAAEIDKTFDSAQ